MTPHKGYDSILSIGTLCLFVFVVLSGSFCNISLKQPGVYQRGGAHTNAHAGVGRAQARDFKAGFAVDRNDAPKRITKFVHSGTPFPGVAAVEKTCCSYFTKPPVSNDLVFTYSPVLTL
jgi:hypothetical protein